MEIHTFWYMIGLAVHINLTNMYLHVIKSADSFFSFCFSHLFFSNTMILEMNTAHFPLPTRTNKRATKLWKANCLHCICLYRIYFGQGSTVVHNSKALVDWTFYLLSVFLFKSKTLRQFQEEHGICCFQHLK